MIEITTRLFIDYDNTDESDERDAVVELLDDRYGKDGYRIVRMGPKPLSNHEFSISTGQMVVIVGEPESEREQTAIYFYTVTATRKGDPGVILGIYSGLLEIDGGRTIEDEAVAAHDLAIKTAKSVGSAPSWIEDAVFVPTALNKIG